MFIKYYYQLANRYQDSIPNIISFMTRSGFVIILLLIINASLGSESLLVGIPAFLLMLSIAGAYFLIILIKTFNRLKTEKDVFKTHKVQETTYSVMFTFAFAGILFIPSVLIFSVLTAY